MAVQGYLSSSKTANSQDRNMLLNYYRSLGQHNSNLCLWSTKQFTKQGHLQWATRRVPPEGQRGTSTFLLHCFGEGSRSCSTFSFPLKITFLFDFKSIMLPNIQECRCLTSAPGRGVFKQINLCGPALPSSALGQERRAEEGRLGKGKAMERFFSEL